MAGSLLRFPYKTLRLSRRLTDQQLWTFGRDVMAIPDVLAKHGWTYHARPHRARGSARLTTLLPHGGHLSLWGFGFLASDPAHGAVYLDRRNFRPTYRSNVDTPPSLHAVVDLPRFRSPVNAEQADAVLYLLEKLAERMANHEVTIISELGIDYRKTCIKQWKFQNSALEPETVPPLWMELKTEVRSMRDAGEYASQALGAPSKNSVCFSAANSKRGNIT